MAARLPDISEIPQSRSFGQLKRPGEFFRYRGLVTWSIPPSRKSRLYLSHTMRIYLGAVELSALLLCRVTKALYSVQGTVENLSPPLHGTQNTGHIPFPCRFIVLAWDDHPKLRYPWNT
jgi:hypothetical protein